jgi:hypothetical protein
LELAVQLYKKLHKGHTHKVSGIPLEGEVVQLKPDETFMWFKSYGMEMLLCWVSHNVTKRRGVGCDSVPWRSIGTEATSWGDTKQPRNYSGFISNPTDRITYLFYMVM